MNPRDTFPVIISRPSTAAYRADLASRDGAFGADDGAWVAVTSLLEHASLIPDPDRSRLLIDAIEFAREVLGEATVQRRAQREWQDRDRTPAEAIMLLAEDLHRAGALNLAGTMLDALLVADTSLNAVQRGRIIVQRSRVLRKLGLMDETAECIRYVLRLGRQSKSTELRASAYVALATTAQLRGNYPELLRHAQRAARLAERDGLEKLARDARNGLVIAFGSTRRFDEALVNGWKVYQSSLGNPADEGEILQNLAQLLLDAGHFAAARAGFSAVVAKYRPAHIVLPALGGLAIASAATGHHDTVEWAAAEIQRLSTSAAPRYSVASAFLEAAIALWRLGKSELSNRYRYAAIEVAEAHSFHEIAFRAEGLETLAEVASVPATRALTKAAATIATEVAFLEPERLPPHVPLTVASLDA